MQPTQPVLRRTGGLVAQPKMAAGHPALGSPKESIAQAAWSTAAAHFPNSAASMPSYDHRPVARAALARQRQDSWCRAATAAKAAQAGTCRGQGEQAGKAERCKGVPVGGMPAGRAGQSPMVRASLTKQ